VVQNSATEFVEAVRTDDIDNMEPLINTGVEDQYTTMLGTPKESVEVDVITTTKNLAIDENVSFLSQAESGSHDFTYVVQR